MKRILLFLVFLLTSAACEAEAAEQQENIKVSVIAQGLEHPWAMEFLPDGRMLVTERPGRLRYVSKDGEISAPLSGVPAVLTEGQGGLLDVALDPDFANNHLIYFSYAEPQGDKVGTAVARAKLANNTLEDIEVIFRQQPKTEGSKHFGSRLVFARDGTLFITLGERFDYSDQAQKLDNHLGKLIRIHSDGTVPPDNPFIGRTGALPEIWSYGHRNIQGGALHPDTGILWIHEHGPRGGDEINIPEAGKNYGWPEVSYGSHYSLIPIEDDHKGQGFEEPLYYWTPSIAPSGMMFYTGDAFPQWHGNLFVGALVKTHLARLELKDNRILKEEKLLEDMELRIRDVIQGPDGYIYLLTDAQKGKILKLGTVAK